MGILDRPEGGDIETYRASADVREKFKGMAKKNKPADPKPRPKKK